ncbi:MAG TPA: low temperature requirement protein A [Chitinophagales bacterium]|nr:low temperature requirement protein A [Chitinophagales bacterium]
MQIRKGATAWWGPPKKFEPLQKERRISWLELFFDLVYVIAISHITHHLAAHISFNSFLEYCCLFTLIYWGWLNGSIYHDLHGNEGLRTRLITLWQMMIIAAIVIALEIHPDPHHHYIIIVFMIMQLYITYLWWSVGWYDKGHRRYSWPYILLYLISFGLMAYSLFLPDSSLQFIIPFIIICNYSPPFISYFYLNRTSREFNLSSSMFERLGLLTIILFGELVLGVVNGVIGINTFDFSLWLNFALAMTIAFALWWIFFTVIAAREAKDNFLRASLLELIYLPTIIALGFLAAIFSSFFGEASTVDLQPLFGYGIAAFLICVSLLTGLLKYPNTFDDLISQLRFSILITGIVFIIFSLLNFPFSQTLYLIFVIVILTMEILFLNFKYYKRVSQDGINLQEVI